MGYIRKALEKGYLEHPGSACCTDNMFKIFVRLGRCMCCLLPLFFNRQLPCLHTYRSSASHTDHQQQPVLIRDDKFKWVDFGSTPDPVNLQPYPGYVWLKSGYNEAISWRKVGLIKQRNVDLTTDGLWAMPLNEGWVPVKARRLQDWQKLKKYVPVHKQGDVCPNGVPALPEKSNADSDSDSE